MFFRNPNNLNNSNYYHLGPRLGGGLSNYHMVDNNPYNTTLSVPIAQSLQGGYHNARVRDKYNTVSSNKKRNNLKTPHLDRNQY